MPKLDAIATLDQLNRPGAPLQLQCAHLRARALLRQHGPGEVSAAAYRALALIAARRGTRDIMAAADAIADRIEAANGPR